MNESQLLRPTRGTAPRLCLLLGVLIAAAFASAAPAAPAGTAPPRIQLNLVHYALPNGLDVILCEDHRLPVVGVNVWYRVGPANEVPGRTGFAHLFEHLMFKGSGHIPDGMHWKYLQGAGATLVNATTEFDRTDYIEDLPSNQLALALWLESDRMGFLLDGLDQAKLANQQDVVRNERRQTVENVEYGLAEEELYHRLFPKNHPYHADVFGSHADIQAAKLKDVRAFFKRYYCPNNASLAIVGDIDVPKTKALVEKYFGSIPRGEDVPPIAATTPPITSERRVTMTDNVSLPRVYMAWITPGAFQPGEADGAVVADILGGDPPIEWSRDGGKANRLYKRLVYDLRIAQDVTASQTPLQLGSVFEISATAKPGHTAEELEKAIDDEIARFARQGPTQEEVEAAQRTIYFKTVSSLERVGFFNGIAYRLNEYNYFMKDPAYLNKDLDRTAAVTPQSAQRFVARYLTKDSRVVIVALPGEKHLPPAPPTPTPPKPTPFHPSDQEAWRDTPPPPASAPQLELPVPRRFALANGLSVYLVEDHHLPLVNANLVFRSGSAADPQDRAGLAGFTSAMVEAGTDRLDALALADRMHGLGAVWGGGSGPDGTGFTVGSLAASAPAAIGTLAGVVLHPAFRTEEVERTRQDRLAELTRERDSPQETAQRVYLSCLYGPTNPYGHSALGTESSLKQISREDLLGFYKSAYTPKNAALVLTGDLTEAEAQKMAESLFGGWTGDAPPSPVTPSGTEVASRVVLVDKPGAAQTRVIVGQLTVARNDPEFDRLRLLNTVMGGAFTSRINMNLREQHGYTYGIYSRLSENRGPGHLEASGSVRTDVTGPAIGEILKEVEGMKDHPVTQEELTRAKGANIQALPGRFETLGAVAGQIGGLFTFGLPDDYFQTLPARLGAITTQDLASAATKYLTPDRMLVVAVGDRAKIAPQIESLGLGEISYRDPDGNEAGAPAKPMTN